MAAHLTVSLFVANFSPIELPNFSPANSPILFPKNIPSKPPPIFEIALVVLSVSVIN